MPILDPSLQYFLLNNDSKQKDDENGYPFFLKYLQFASINLYQSFETIEALSQFKKDFNSSIQLINEKFGCNFESKKEFENQNVANHYKYLFDHINRPNKIQESKKSIGTYKIGNDKFRTKFYQPHILYSKYHSWYFSDTPIAILCINSDKFNEIGDDNNYQKIFQLIKLEIDLVSASGLTLVLCYNATSNTEDFLYKIIKDDQFSELHVDIFDEILLKNFLTFMKDNYYNNSNRFKGYLYLYSYFFAEQSEGWHLMKIFRQIPCTKTISFSLHPNEALKQVLFIPTEPFFHCKTGFNQRYLRIFLCFVPYYLKNSSIPTEICELCQGFISPSDFLYQKKNKNIKILFKDEKNQSQFEYEVNFQDIHLMKTDLFVTDTLTLTPMDVEMHKKIDIVIEKVNHKFEDKKKLQKSYINNIGFKDYLSVIHRVIYAYTYFMRSKSETNKEYKNFTVRQTQIYAIIEACHSFFKKETDTNKKSNGIIYQIKTGEGKSCIISIIAAVLAIKKFTVHVASSNITLCKRDYLDSLEFFKLLKLESAVLLHYNELPKCDNKSNFNEEEIKQMNEKLKLQFPDKYFNDELFNNPSRMNFSVCGLDANNNLSNKGDIIFSTFVNFECFFLHLMENCPGYCNEEYFKKCGLVIDEADSILIDEITNGTIVSREMNSNAKEVLSLVYKLHENHTEQQTLDELKKHKLCDEIDLEDVKQMYQDIKIVKNPEFRHGKKYVIESFKVKNNHRIKNLIKKTTEFIKSIPTDFSEVVEEVKEAKDAFFSTIKAGINDDNEEEDNDKDEDDLNTSKYKEFKRIVPFDYDHKGSLERNKEFSGYIPQFIALKEGSRFINNNLLFKGMSISYLYISHPIFANLYCNICGFTGTIGKQNEKIILSKQYCLTTKKVPRYKPNLRVDFPLTACETISERNDKIFQEIIKIHEKGNPILVIFRDMNDVTEFAKNLKFKFNKDNMYYKANYLEAKNKIYVFDGQDELAKPDYIAGAKGAISIGTNICGRGTDIKCVSSLPLHVIVGYYSTNNRVMEQAFGRTARNGRIGTCHCICLETELCQEYSLKPENITSIINDVDLKSEKQKEFINVFTENRPWIFDFKFDKQCYKNSEQILKLRYLRKSKINVNRIVAYKYKFPICMSYQTFLKIQAQKIVSIYNCPNCKYSWRIFQKYIREMILQSWSIMINKLDQKYKINQLPKESFNKSLDEECKLLIEAIEKYIPNKNIHKEDFGMIPTFIHIYQYVWNENDKENRINKILGKFNDFYKFFGDPTGSVCAQLGFKPYELIGKSGAHIAKDEDDDEDEANFIHDPELSYEKKMPDNSISFISITERIDEIFNKILQKVSSVLSEKIFLKFFLRRTLAGCEFGVCLDIDFEDKDSSNDPYLLIDKKPLFVATIYIWSMIPVLAGILICVLIYLAGIAKEIFVFISTFPVSFPKEVIKKVGKKILMKVISNFTPDIGSMVYSKILDYLSKILDKEIEKLKNDDDMISILIQKLKEILIDNDNTENYYEMLSNKISGFFEGKIKISTNFQDFLDDFDLDGPSLIKISVLLILCFASFVKHFVNNKARIKESKSDSKEYDSAFDNKDQIKKEAKSNEKLKKIKKRKKKTNQSEIQIEKNKHSQKEIAICEKISKSPLLNLLTTDLKKKSIKYFQIKSISNKNDNLCIHKSSKEIYKKIYVQLTGSFYKYADLFAKMQIKSIVPFYGFVLNGQKSFFLFNSYLNNSFYSYLGKKYNDEMLVFEFLEDAFIFAYGISNAMNFLEKNKVEFPLLHPDNILLFDKMNPIIFPLASNLKILYKNYPELLPPELKKKPIKFTYKSNVFVLGKILLARSRLTEEDICMYEDSEMFGDVDIETILIKGKDDKFGQMWFPLIERCIDEDPNNRPTFSELCNIIEIESTKKKEKFKNDEYPLLVKYIDNLKL